MTDATSALLLRVPEAEPLLAEWWGKGSPPEGDRGGDRLPAHVTLLAPFLPPDRIDDGVLAELEWFFAGVDAFPVRFAATGTVAESGLLFLEPAGDELPQLTAALARRWPEAPPYAGRVAEPTAHLTVLRSDDAGLRAEAGSAVEATLPLQAVAEQAALWVCDSDGAWSERAVFRFGPPE